jgi:uncharacterized protein
MYEKLFFENSKKNKLIGILSNPSNNKSKPIIILCHGFFSSKDSRTFTSFEKLLNEKNISTFRFDFLGHGESEGLFEDITISEAVDDILNAIKFLKDLGYNKIGLIGSSFGGISSIMAASKTNELFVLGLKCPVSDYYETTKRKKSEEELIMWKEVGFDFYIRKDKTALRLNYTFYEDFKNNDAYKAAELINIPTLIVHGNKDQLVPIDQSIKTSKIIKNCKLEIIENADHFFKEKEHFEKMLNLFVEFVEEESKKWINIIN